MLRIRRVRKYSVAKYPEKVYSRRSSRLPKVVFGGGAASLAMLILLDSCDGLGGRGIGMMGPPPAMADMLTENEARQIIEHVFSNRRVVLDNDVRLVLHYGQNDSAEVVLDGYNDSLEVGYEYICDPEDTTFTAEVKEALEDSLASHEAPSIKVLDSIRKFPGHQEYLEQAVEQFIDTLQANGVI